VGLVYIVIVDDWKVEKVNYKFGIGSFLILYFDWTQKLKFSDCSNLIRIEFQQPGQLQKVITPKPLVVLRCANNRWKDEKLFAS
jgi:hypothetical protein